MVGVRVSMGRIGFGSGHIILLLSLTRPEPDPIKFGLKKFNSYPTRRITDRPDPTRIK
jgi:hypothetical protein